MLNVSSLKVMASSSRQAKVLTTIKKGASVTYLSQKTSWGKIKTTSGITGWVANRDLSTTKPAGTSNTEPVAETASNNKVQSLQSILLMLWPLAVDKLKSCQYSKKGLLSPIYLKRLAGEKLRPLLALQAGLLIVVYPLQNQKGLATQTL